MNPASTKGSWQTKSLREPNMTEYRLQLKCRKIYELMIIAWNERGSSKADGKTVHVRTEKGIKVNFYWNVYKKKKLMKVTAPLLQEFHDPHQPKNLTQKKIKKGERSEIKKKYVT